MKMILYGGPILTLEGHRQNPEAILIEQGRIEALGAYQTLAALHPEAERVNLHGAALMPAFIDPHSHFSQVAASMMQVSLLGAGSLAEIQERISNYIRENAVPKGSFVVACNYDHNRLPAGQRPDRAFLDACAPENPLLIQHQSGHMGLANREALAFFGITGDTPDPEGGRIEKRDGTPTGYLEENAFFIYNKRVPMAKPEDFRKAYARAQDYYASFGITTVQEGFMVQEMLPLYQMLVHANLLKLDLVGYPDTDSFEDYAAAFPKSRQGYDSHFRLGGLKIFLDGSPQGRTAFMRTPYADDPSDCGYGTMEDGAVVGALNQAVRENVQLLAHCNGDAAAAQLLHCAGSVEQEHPQLKALRPVMIHAQLLGLDQLLDVQRLGIIPSFFVAHVRYWGDVHIKNFGLERAEHISPAASAQKLGIPYTFHQDAPVLPPNMLDTIAVAMDRRTEAGVLLGENERVSARQACEAVTKNAAHQYFEETQKGTIREGKLADLVVLDGDPLSATPEEIRKIRVLMTLKGGRAVYRAPGAPDCPEIG